jgi:hypothetical protein
MHAEALAVMIAVTADFVFNRWDFEILPYYRIRHIPWCDRYHAQSLRLEVSEYQRVCWTRLWFPRVVFRRPRLV